MATMGSLIGLVNRIQRACTVLGDHGGGGEGSLWEALPSVAVVGGQVRAAAASLPDPLAPVPDLASALAHGLVLVFFLSPDDASRVPGSRRCSRA